jgi:cyclohexanone monooxygenase
MSLVQSGVAQNYMYIAEAQVEHFAYVIARCRERGIAAIEPSAETENAWVEEILAASDARKVFLETCTPGLFNYEGRRPGFAELNGTYAAGPVPYVRLLEDWRAEGTLRGMQTTAAG